MINSKITLNNIVASNKSIIFDTDFGIFIGHNEYSNIMDPTISTYPQYNKWNFNTLDKNLMMRNFYPLSSFSIHSYQYKKSPMNRQNNIDDFLSIFGPNNSYITGCQYFNFGYYLTSLTNKSISAENLFFNSDIFASSYLSTIEYPINTYIYPSSSIILTSTDISSAINTFIPLYNLSGIDYNFIEEFPLDFMYNGYDKDNSISSYYYTFADSFNAKNAYSYNYSVESVLTSATTTSNVSATLNNARQYYDIGSTGDLLYMIYRTNISYSSSGITSLSGTGITYGMLPTSSFASTGNIVNVELTNSTPITSSVINKYDNVEVLHSINRIKNNDGHKSNLFSINIQNSNIDSSILSDNEKANIKLGLNNIIESIIKNIIPANTQLFNIYWNGN